MGGFVGLEEVLLKMRERMLVSLFSVPRGFQKVELPSFRDLFYAGSFLASSEKIFPELLLGRSIYGF